MTCNTKLPVSVLIMCQNEEKNITHTLDSIVSHFDQIVVVDSFSTDETKTVVKRYKTIEFYENKFEGWAEQRNWILTNCKINNQIVFFLDSDEIVSDNFILELRSLIDKEFDSIQFGVDMYFMGRHIKHAYGHPKIKRIFKRDHVRFHSEGAREYSNYQSVVLNMQERIIHNDRRGIYCWIEKHNKNSTREAYEFLRCVKNSQSVKRPKVNVLSHIKIWVRAHIWNRMPLYVRPFFYFTYRYFIQLGFLDGSAGFLYCFLHALWYPMLIDAKIKESADDSKIFD